MYEKSKLLSVILIMMILFHGFILSETMGGDSFLPPKERYNDRSNKLFCLDKTGTMYIIDPEFDRMKLNIRKLDGDVMHFKQEAMNESSIILNSSERKKLAESEPVLYQIKNMKSYKNGVVLISDIAEKRLVQFIDSDLNILNTWENIGLEYSSGIDFLEPFVVIKNASIFAIGEKGEFLGYNSDGKIIKRLVIPKVFNKSRVIQPEPVSKDYKRYYSTIPGAIEKRKGNLKYDAKRSTELLVVRDKHLPEPVFLKGPEMPKSIKSMEVRENDNIIILDRAGKLFEMSLAKGTINSLKIPAFKLNKWTNNIDDDERGEKLNEDSDWEYEEKLIDIRCKKDVLYLLTNYRGLSVVLKPKIKIVREVHFPDDDNNSFEAYDAIAWDVKPLKLPIFLFPNLDTQKIDKYILSADMIGKPLNRNDRYKKEKIDPEILKQNTIYEKWQTRRKIEQKVIPVTKDHQTMIVEIVKNYFNYLLKGNIKKCTLLLAEDLIYDKKYDREIYINKAFSCWNSLLKGQKVARLDPQLKDICYTNSDKNILKATFDVSFYNKGKAFQRRKPFTFRFIKTKDIWCFFEIP